MVLLGLLGDVHKVNCTWNLKAIDEFQSLLIFAGQIREPVFLPKHGVSQISLNYEYFPVRFP